MEILKSRTTLILTLMICGVAFLGGVDNTNLKDTPDYNNAIVNA